MSAFGKLLGLGTLAAVTAGTLAYVKKQQELAAQAANGENEPAEAPAADENEDLKALFEEVDEAAESEEATEEAKANADVIKKNLKEIFAILAGGAKEVGNKVTTFAEEKGLNEKLESLGGLFEEKFEELKNMIKPAEKEEEMTEEELKEAAEDLKAELDEELGCAAEEVKEAAEEVKEACCDAAEEAKDCVQE